MEKLQEEHDDNLTKKKKKTKNTCQSVPRWDKGRQTAPTEEVDADVSRSKRGGLVSVLRVKLGTHAGEKEDKSMAEHAGYAKVENL